MHSEGAESGSPLNHTPGLGESQNPPGSTLISPRCGVNVMDPTVPRPRRSYTYLLSIAGGVLVCIDYVLDTLLVASIAPGDATVLNALPFVLGGLACGFAMVAGAFLSQSHGERRWPYLLLGSSLLTLFLPYLTVISAVGGVLGAATSTYLLSKRRMQPPVKSV